MKRKLTIAFSILVFFSALKATSEENSTKQLQARIQRMDYAAYKLGIEDLQSSFPEISKDAEKYLNALAQLEKNKHVFITGIQQNSEESIKNASELLAILDEGLLANPLLDFDKTIMLRGELGKNARTAMSGALGIAPADHNNNLLIPHPDNKWENEISVLSYVRKNRNVKTIYKPKTNKVINDLCLNFDGEELMFSTIGSNNKLIIAILTTDYKFYIK